jgi:hypothetical protein
VQDLFKRWSAFIVPCSCTSQLAWASALNSCLLFLNPAATDGAFPEDKVREPCRCQKKALRVSSGALLCRAANTLINFNKLRIARLLHPESFPVIAIARIIAAEIEKQDFGAAFIQVLYD